MALSPLILLNVAVAGVAALALVLNLAGVAQDVPAYVAAAGLLVAAVLFVSGRVGPFLRFFIVIYAMGYAFLAGWLLLKPLLPSMAATYAPPALTAFTAAAFALLAFGLSRVPVMRQIMGISDAYFVTPDRATFELWPFRPFAFDVRWMAMALLTIIILINLGQVWISVQLSFWNRNWFDAIQNKNAPEFWRLLFQVWVPIVAVLIVSNIIEFLIVSAFKIRWRQWLTERLIGRWLDDGTHYRLQFQGRDSVDNPDQRIAEDVRKYVDTTYSLTISMISQISSLVSFAVILWSLSDNLTLPGLDTKIPGLLFWVALLYAAVGTYITHRIGRRLIALNFQQEVYEANFRFGLARLREYSEPVALLSGERAEKARLGGQFRRVIDNFFSIVAVQKWLSAFVQLYGSSNSVVPIVITAPFYFTGQITLGVLTQTSQAFARVDLALSFFIDRYATLADFKAVVDRLSGFDESIALAEALRRDSTIALPSQPGTDVAIPSLALSLPQGEPLLAIRNLVLRKGESVLLNGPSGSGKSTLFRAIAGLWPFGRGEVRVPEGATVMLLPQRPYLPIGSLRAAVTYPGVAGDYPDDVVADALRAAQLEGLADRLNEEANWSQRLSGGEQQRLAVARALLARPDWLFLDEATAALDEATEEAIYRAIFRKLPGTTVVSIGHRSTLAAFHQRRLGLVRGEDGLFTLKETVPA